ncbi:MAG: cyclic dehypoxanthinyl futalosine synthase [Armatimonadota bacterium]
MPNVDEILNNTVAGNRISDKDALILFKDANLLDLGLSADVVTRRLHPETYRTYVVDRNINYTNVCVSKCKFCAFCRDKDSEDAYFLDDSEIANKIQQAVDLGATQILMQGGLHPDYGIDFYIQLISTIRNRFPNIHIHSFSAPEIIHFSRISGISIKQTIELLKNAGLDSIPGGGAEILADSCRSVISPMKYTADEWIDVMETAHRLGMKSTATMMFGHIETYVDRVEHLTRIRDLQDRTGGFTAFIPWTFQSVNTELGGNPIGAHEYLKTLAISRIYLDNIPNIQASWVTQGPKIGQISLFFGANDLGSTMIEENVVAAAGVSFMIDESNLRSLIVEAGFVPKKRDTYYRILE